ncbi:hypothetical protein ES288_A06G183600v1 [Gossypium darwinii]|uniref:F-box protein n=1 Tax=Gossypium darwinii TaxID=34276 RepID=A0A5D2G761_GOSDA|nr:hypothetical protein ES288_A06G183600v1 [Gossypium darwinii]
MAGIQVSSSLLLSKSLPSLRYRREIVGARVNAPRVHLGVVSHPKLSSRYLVDEMETRTGYPIARHDTKSSDDPQVIAKLYAIMEAIADRVEMHKNIGEQRDNWNGLLLTSINAMTLSGATMAGLAALAAEGSPLMAFKLSSIVLYVAATGLLLVMNKIQPSQLAEEQRSAARLFKQLRVQIETTLALGKLDINDVNEAMEKVLALAKAYPLPLLGSMLEKFPSKVEPARWWPKQRSKQGFVGKIEGNNGWTRKLEEEMRQVVRVLKQKDYLGSKALKLNKMLAISVVAGAVATTVNLLEHGGQVGMVFEMYRGNAGFFKLIEENIMSNINEKDVERRENGEILEMKVALQLGRSLSELKQLAAIAECSEEFASKLF